MNPNTTRSPEQGWECAHPHHCLVRSKTCPSPQTQSPESSGRSYQPMTGLGRVSQASALQSAFPLAGVFGSRPALPVLPLPRFLPRFLQSCRSDCFLTSTHSRAPGGSPRAPWVSIGSLADSHRSTEHPLMDQHVSSCTTSCCHPQSLAPGTGAVNS